jgi:hypothetical protein
VGLSGLVRLCGPSFSGIRQLGKKQVPRPKAIHRSQVFVRQGYRAGAAQPTTPVPNAQLLSQHPFCKQTPRPIHATREQAPRSAMADLPKPKRRFSRPPVSREAYEQLWKESRLGLPPMIRIPAATVSSFSIGFILGVAQGSKMAGLRFRAEHAHKLPTTTTGWYLYHKSKNYHSMFGGLREGIKNGLRLSMITTAVFCTENLFDVYRGSKDMFNTVAASLAVSGGFSIISPLFFFSFSFHPLSCPPVLLNVYQPFVHIHRSILCSRRSQNGSEGPQVWLCLRRCPGPAVPSPGSTGRIR